MMLYLSAWAVKRFGTTPGNSSVAGQSRETVASSKLSINSARRASDTLARSAIVYAPMEAISL